MNGSTPAKFWLRGIFLRTSAAFSKTSLVVHFQNSEDLLEYFEVVNKKIPKGSLARYPSTKWKNPINSGTGYVNLMEKDSTVICKLWDFTETPEKPQQRDWIHLQEGDMLSMHLSFTVTCTDKGLSVKMTLIEAKLLSRGNSLSGLDSASLPPVLTTEEKEIVESYQKEDISKKVKLELID
jgi:hypothetical protein